VWDQRPVGCLFLVPLWHPVLMAEQIGTLAAIAAAPFIIQAGAGDGQAQFAAMGKDLPDRAARTERGIRLVKALLDGERSTTRNGTSKVRISRLGQPMGRSGGSAAVCSDRSIGPPGMATCAAPERGDLCGHVHGRHG
jgi:alkanesulfonate monooxygenase SsuD/methylene tetrahydromethanopterin reductase-like flavin-dependent oxidoreductase (luciferase family)